MYHLNRVTLVGRVGADPEIRHLENNVAVAKFPLATSDRYMDKNGQWQDTPTEWHDIVLWRNLAERAEAELQKGKLVYIEGKIAYRTWEDKDGNKRKSTDIVVRQFRCFETPNSSGGGGGSRNFPTAEDAPPTPPRRESSPSTGGSNASPAFDEDDGDLPF